MIGRGGAKTRAGRAFLARIGAVSAPAPGKSKYRSQWTRYAGENLHTTGRDCPDAEDGPCPICSARTSADAQWWYRSRAEASMARKLDLEVKLGKIRGWQRSKPVLLVDAPNPKERIRYQPDMDVWIVGTPHVDPIDERVEVKASAKFIVYSGLLKIRKYREFVRAGTQPPLRIVNGKGVTLNVV